MEFLNAYCERGGDPGLLAEPFNAVTNLAFLAAAALAFLRLRARGQDLRSSPDLHLLAGTILAIGLGSGAWHLAPNRWTVLADVVPITIFIHLYLGVFLVRLLGMGVGAATLIVVAFFIVGIAAGSLVPRGALNGTEGYLPAYGALLVLTAVLFFRGDGLWRRMSGITLLWTVSLALRTIDQPICPVFGLGSHGFWHMLNAAVLFFLITVLFAPNARR